MLRALLVFAVVAPSLLLATASLAADPPAATPAAQPLSALMANCPTAVPGAATAVKDVDGAVALTVTASDKDAVAQIRTRAKALVASSKATGPAGKHDSKGDGGGRVGRCPVVMFKSTVTSADVEGGVTLTVKPEGAAQLEMLRKETRERLAEQVATAQGHGKMAHCPSAVEGAVTKVADTKDGVVVTVTGKDAKAIRTRTAELLASAATPEEAVGHAGHGEGGGGFGRCPVVVKDTTITAKDVEGGSAITVVSKHPVGVIELQKETRDRAGRFAAPK